MVPPDPSPGRAERRPEKKRRRLHQRVLTALAEWGLSRYIWLLCLTCRIRVVHGAAELDAVLAAGRADDSPVVPCAWHQSLVSSAIFMRAQRQRGLQVGFLISPSREGRFMSDVAHAHKMTAIRGSSSRTGKAAMAALTEAVRAGISPMMYGDGPRGPAQVFKPGAVVLASRSGAPLLLVGATASRYVQLRSWDACHIPMPFCRLDVAIGMPWSIGTLEGPDQAQSIATELGDRLVELNRIAAGAGTRVAPGRA
ncbi:MAG: hypothetical protein CMP08_06835 [Xanthomonadales bacterium]|nr:hypothetical protein [Xanthomonadales bacterium]